MNTGNVAFLALGRRQPAHASDVKRLHTKAAAHQFADQQVDAHAVAADDDQVGGFEALTQQLHGDLAKAKADLESRKTVERAKGLLMKERGLDEDGAYRLLRKLAMDRGKPIGAVAGDLLAFAGVLKGDGS